VTTSFGASPAMEVTLSRKGAKSRTRGRKLRLTGAKARVGRVRKTRVDLEQQLKECRREIAHARERLVEAAKQQTATSEMLRIISSSPIQSVLDAVAENAARLCDANNAEIFRLEGNLLRLAASYGEIPVVIHAYQGVLVNRDTVTGRAACDRRTIHVHDLAAEEGEYPVGSSNAKREGHRTTLATPLLRQGTPIGIILARRMEIRPFSDKQIALLETFADEAVIAIENVRLFEAEKQRTLALAHANRDLAEREARIRRLVDANIIGIFIWDFDGRILEANEAFLRIVGYDHEDLVAGRIRWTDLTPPEWRDRDTRLMQEHKVTGILPPFEKEYFRKDGSRVPVLIGVATFEEGGNQGVAFVLDLTERKSAEERLRRLESDLAHMNRVSMMGELAASLSHEITQPIASARNNARAAQNFLDMQPPDLSEVREALSCVVDDTDRAGDMIERMRDHLKKAPPRKAQFDLNEAINEVIVLGGSAVIKNGVSVQTRLSEGLLPIRGDRVQLQQVVLNLLLNAVEAMGSTEAGARELLISTEQDRTGVLVAVHDSGPGIDPSHRERVFESFYTTKPSGTGMGLSICRSIIDAHGGRLWAEANEPRGTVFQFTLPAA
jgi:PAS domain S-box-containing protein